MTRRAGPGWPPLRSRWWRTCIVWYALLALAWPSLGPLPYLVHGFHSQFEHVDGHAHAGDDAARGEAAVGHHDDRHVDASSIPGSPTHPADHNCAECEVLKHLSRCALPTLVIAVCAPVVVAMETPLPAVAPSHAQVVAHLPPVRAPPIALA